ncbi:hypothetical protein PISMIDRAFT_676174 [Pisolithus microcarpus 441]|uniref:Uncharacterized protein n=1 Tax=Pisolithus microcarpus 441 TaxID=765257 RepID=A0A0C9YMX3_9AGAM|nr:hypothetical protein PISMIDRAFT_676174 [Pisolithus microcarpus 441]
MKSAIVVELCGRLRKTATHNASVDRFPVHSADMVSLAERTMNANYSLFAQIV